MGMKAAICPVHEKAQRSSLPDYSPPPLSIIAATSSTPIGGLQAAGCSAGEWQGQRPGVWRGV